jgi:hypothetical protein
MAGENYWDLTEEERKNIGSNLPAILPPSTPEQYKMKTVMGEEVGNPYGGTTEVPIGIPQYNEQTKSWTKGEGITRVLPTPNTTPGEETWGPYGLPKSKLPNAWPKLTAKPNMEATGGVIEPTKGQKAFIEFEKERKRNQDEIGNLSWEQLQNRLSYIDQGHVKTDPAYHQLLLDEWKKRTKEQSPILSMNTGEMGTRLLNAPIPPSGGGWMQNVTTGKMYTMGNVPQQSQENNPQEAIQRWLDWAEQRRNAGTFSRTDAEKLTAAVSSIMGVQMAPSEMGERGARTGYYRRKAMEPFNVMQGSNIVSTGANLNTGEYVPIATAPNPAMLTAESRMTGQETMDRSMLESYFRNPVYDEKGNPPAYIIMLMKKYGYDISGFNK